MHYSMLIIFVSGRAEVARIFFYFMEFLRSIDEIDVRHGHGLGLLQCALKGKKFSLYPPLGACMEKAEVMGIFFLFCHTDQSIKLTSDMHMALDC